MNNSKFYNGWPYVLTGLAVSTCISLAGCTSDLHSNDESDTSRAPRDGLDNSDKYELILGDDPDSSVFEDANRLMSSFPVVEGFESDEKIVIEYLGLGAVAPAPAQIEAPAVAPLSDAELDALGGNDPNYTSFVGINLATRNQFLITAPRGLITGLAPPTEAGEPDINAGPGDFDDPEAAVQEMLRGWSANQDNRQRVYGVNSGVGGVQRWQTQLGGGCSGSLVGPRHIATAGHCLYNFATATWSDNYTVRAGANGTSSLASVLINSSNTPPPGEDLWFFAHPDYISTGQREFDFGILVTPKRLAGAGAGQTGCYDGQCWFGYATYSDANTSSYNLSRRGYPICDPTFAGLTARIDEPCQVNAPTGTTRTCTTTPCNPNHLYGPEVTCTAADFTSVDPDGWARILHHGCDASAGDSGSPLYHKHPTLNWLILSVQTAQECGMTTPCPASPANRLARPLIDTRLTPEYRGWITHFRNTYP